MDLNIFFCFRSNLCNYNTISALRPGLKTGMENYIIWSEIGSEFGEPGGIPPPRIPRSTQQPPPPRGGGGKVIGFTKSPRLGLCKRIQIRNP